MSFNYEAYNNSQGLHSATGRVGGAYGSSLQDALAAGRPKSSLPTHYRAVPHPMPVLGDVTNRGAAKLHQPVTFDFTTGMRGVPLQDLLSRSQHGVGQILKGAGDAALACTGLKSIALLVTWPGYEHFNFAAPIDIVLPTGHITRGQLGHAVAKCMAAFMEKVGPNGKDQAWKFGNRIRYQDMVLLSIWNIRQDTWQVEIALVM
ncbi:hypothetical protein BD626DRAFT_564156 [Schizophyllum amplum]|uniref:Uncharacterized protein n=1 Tax=Schizophyllum amplum TaxID=97359 RepID=A0A550D0H8_9AGAR|nr:hypothetical protein BD626DRAFT_564156 [Auriculariopsis ampla]